MNVYLKLIFLALFLPSCQQLQKPDSSQKNEKSTVKPLSLENIADSLYNQNAYAEAIKYFDTLIKLHPREGIFYFRRAYSYDMIYKRPELQQAITDYLKSIDLGYDKAKGYKNLGLSYLFVKDSIALVYFEKSLKENPNNPDVITLWELCKKRLTEKKHPQRGNKL